MAIDIVNEELIRFGKIPSWCEKHSGKRIHPSTAHRWRLRGIRGVKLESILIGGTRFTSQEALVRFFESSTAAQDGTPVSVRQTIDEERYAKAEAYLKSEGI